MEDYHKPVMAEEVLSFIKEVPAGLLVDCTLGGAGHAARMLDARPDCELLGIDRDQDAIGESKERLQKFQGRYTIEQGSFEEVAEILKSSAYKDMKVVGMLFDLGISSKQIDVPSKGFAYRFANAPLDMRMDASQHLTAAIILSSYTERELADVIYRYGEERKSRQIAKSIVNKRRTAPLETAQDLIDCIIKSLPTGFRKNSSIKRVFQAIRMEVNRELPALANSLEESVHVMSQGGRVMVMSYHSLEDRMVKRFIYEKQNQGVFKNLTKKPLIASDVETAENPRARSAKLRVAEKV
jgi:16S rRNA (cytosine1402-N4)-methyltransferase